MASKKKEMTIDDVLQSIYYFLKEKLNFDDIQATTTIASIILLPITIVFGFLYTQIEMLQTSLYITIGLDVAVLLYSIIKYKYLKIKDLSSSQNLNTKQLK